ncbi:MAG: ferredoxin [Dehalococcoidia bacterium]|nr:ferredoxin [Chloroflexota bacterium]MXY37006.1 ferredoxin [Dehalococcoidia bacterium]MYG49714.1 ferredoxin [Gemmatimonadales bacterium]MDE2668043.1 ferredoxin [Chloroflexota bacterium]MDE2932758.1 ferredoxin [Chloroflexota bacterium]
MKLTVNLDRCIKAAECSTYHAELFAAREDGFPVVIVEEPEGDQVEDAEDAVRVCPGNAIALIDDD